MPTFSNGESGESVRAKINAAIQQIEGFASANLSYATLAEFEAAVDNGLTADDGATATANGIDYIAESGNTSLSPSLPGWRYADAEVKTQYERNADTNAFTDAEKAKLAGIEDGATAGLPSASEVKTLYESNANTNSFTDAEKTKLGGVEDGATADQSAAEIKSAYESNADTNAFTDANHAKLIGIEAGATADQSDAEIETAYNNQVGQVSAGEITAGTETAIRRFSPANVAAMAAAHGGGGAVDQISIDTADAPDLTWNISDYFGGSFRAQSKFETDETATFAGPRSSLVVSRKTTGSGTSGIQYADAALHVMTARTDPASTVEGEVDGLRVNAFGAVKSDVGGALFGAYKPLGSGAIDEGGVTTIEASCRRWNTDISDLVHQHQCIVGFSPNPAGAWSGRDTIGFYSENHTGDAYSHFLGINDGADAGTGTAEYLLAGFRQRDSASRYYSVDDQGNTEAISNDGGSGAGPIMTLRRASGSPAANDVMGDLQFYGKDSGGNDTRYARLYSAITDATNGSEDGRIEIYVIVAGTETRQIQIGNGLSVGSVSTQGTGSVNISGAYYVNSAQAVDSSGGLRLPTYTAAQIASASNAVNTTNKVNGKCVWDVTNNRMLTASGSATTSPWYVANGLVAINPS